MPLVVRQLTTFLLLAHLVFWPIVAFVAGYAIGMLQPYVQAWLQRRRLAKYGPPSLIPPEYSSTRQLRRLYGRGFGHELARRRGR